MSDGGVEAFALLPVERQQRILSLLRSRGGMRTCDIASELNVSTATARRDLQELSDRGQVDRIHGGAVVKDRDADVAHEPPYDMKLGRMREEKERLAIRAESLVRDGDTVILDSGTTTLALARLLASRQVTCVALDLPVAHALARGSAEVWIAGGRVRNGLYSVVGPWGEEVLKSIRGAVFFLGADAVDEEVVSNSTVEEASLKRLAILAAQKTILMADHTKFGLRSLATVCTLSEVDVLISDQRLTELPIMRRLKDKIPQIEVI